jgi:hypothetical protein
MVIRGAEFVVVPGVNAATEGIGADAAAAKSTASEAAAEASAHTTAAP